MSRVGRDGAVGFFEVDTIGKEEKTTTGSALDGAVFDITAILAYPLVLNTHRADSRFASSQ